MSEHDKMLMSRHIYPEQGDVVCDNCSGTGVKVYGSTAKWSGGVGGQILTNGVCDKCWGSGKSNEPWPSHRRIADLEAENARLRAVQDAANAWIELLTHRGRFLDGVPGELMDALEAARKP